MFDCASKNFCPWSHQGKPLPWTDIAPRQPWWQPAMGDWGSHGAGRKMTGFLVWPVLCETVICEGYSQQTCQV